MTYSPSDKEIASVIALIGPERYAHLVKRIADTEEVVSLRGAQGWMLAGEDGTELVPIWPHARYAALCAAHDWSEAQPSIISLEEWLEVWTPGMERDGRQVAAFPTPSGKVVQVSPAQLASDLRRELAAYE